VDNDDRIYRFDEFYGWNGTPNQGIRWEDSRIAEFILKKEEDLKISRDRPTRLAGHDCWNKKPDYKGGGQGPSTAEVFANYGIYLNKADSTRETKIRAFRERLKIPDNGERPMLMVYAKCEQFIRTIPLIQMDVTKPEDIDTKMEDHIYDEACHICMARPYGNTLKPSKSSETDKRLEELEKRGSSNSYIETAELDAEKAERSIIEHFERESGYNTDPFEYQESGDNFFDTI